MIITIAAIGKNHELGKKGNLIWHLPGDLKFFKSQTTGKTVVMGRNTFNSLPFMLPNRKHIILTDIDDFNKDIKDSEVFYTFDTLIERVKELSKREDVYIIGGASIYSQFINYSDKLILTEISSEDNEADVYFPEFNKNDYNMKILGKGQDNKIEYNFVEYSKK